MPRTLVFKSLEASSNTALPNYIDPIIPADGMLYIFDLASSVSFVRQATPQDGDVIKDYANNVNGAFQLYSGQSVAFSGGGFDFTGITHDSNYVEAPADLLDDVFDATIQSFLIVMYAKLPASGDFNANAGIFTMFTTTDSELGYTTPEVELVNICQSNTGPSISARRQKNGATSVDLMSVPMSANFYGQVCQIAFWRNADGQALRVKSALGSTKVVAAVSTNNTGDFSAQKMKWGVPAAFNELSVSQHQAAAKFRLYRGWAEDLNVSGRNPETICDTDWTSMATRAAFS